MTFILPYLRRDIKSRWAWGSPSSMTKSGESCLREPVNHLTARFSPGLKAPPFLQRIEIELICRGAKPLRRELVLHMKDRFPRLDEGHQFVTLVELKTLFIEGPIKKMNKVGNLIQIVF